MIMGILISFALLFAFGSAIGSCLRHRREMGKLGLENARLLAQRESRKRELETLETLSQEQTRRVTAIMASLTHHS